MTPHSDEKAPSASRASVPPSGPRPSRASLSAIDIGDSRPGRIQMIVALVLLLLVVAIPLYLWRRPRAEAIAVNGGGDAAPPATEPAPPESPVALGDPKVLSCHDPGPKKTNATECDHVADFEKSFAKAIEDSRDCLPKDVASGTSIPFVADLSFKKRKVDVSVGKDAKGLKNPKLAGTCAAAVRGKLGAVAFDTAAHQHQRYRIEIVATWH